MGGDAVERRRKGQSLLLAERIAIPAAAVSPPTPTAWLRSNSSTRRTTRRPRRRYVCMQTARHPGDRTCQLGSTRALVARGGVATRNRAGCGGRINYSQLMKTIKTRGFIKV